MSWTLVGIGLSSIFSVILIAKLVKLNLQHVYRAFCCFLLLDIILVWSVFTQVLLTKYFSIDYRIFWLATRIVTWTLEIWMVFALLQAILANFPGLLRLSRHLLVYVVVGAVLLTLLSALPEYRAAGALEFTRVVEQAVSIGIVLERVIASVALLVLVAMLFFILWFPVKMPRNLAAFSIGFVFYLGSKTSLLFLRSYYDHSNFTLVNDGVTLVFCGCLVYWIFAINPAGETVPVTLGLRWQSAEQLRLLGHLESLNSALLRSARR